MRSCLPLGSLCVAALLLAGCHDDALVPNPDAQSTDALRPDRGPAPDQTVGPPVTLSVATFNVRNLFDATDDPDKEDDVPSASTVDNKLAAVGAAIRALDADIIALQEIENLELLQRLNREQLADAGYTDVRLLEGNDIRGIDVALLSRHTIVSTTSHARDRFDAVDVGDTKTYGFSRDCLEVVVEPSPARKLVLLVNHLRANDFSDPEAALRARHAQAARVRAIADATLTWNADANLLVLGDLNDSPDSRTLSLITIGDPVLVDLHDSLSLSERYTNLYGGEQNVLDFMLASPGLVADLIAGSARVEHGSVFSSTSDHFPVVARFELR